MYDRKTYWTQNMVDEQAVTGLCNASVSQARGGDEYLACARLVVGSGVSFIRDSLWRAIVAHLKTMADNPNTATYEDIDACGQAMALLSSTP